MLLFIVVHSVICSFSEFDDLLYLSPIHSVYDVEQSAEVLERIQFNNKSSITDECNFCCCQLFTFTSISSKLTQTVNLPVTENFVSNELQGYIALPFRPPKLTPII